ncbi:MAG: polyphenol oxidase family protein [Candidatus Peribacteraceae bacterium]|nr:polyphenol oxidase family protein [Candidatus Peribacteraceae bacterium]MDD5742544.1 polyphenol oxidase family protein [Candidatus Peribacteraceae bacterium]
MNRSPFSLFEPFRDRLIVGMWKKKDHQPHDICGTLGVKSAASAEQVHGAKTVIARGAVEYAPDADGLVTDHTGLALSVRWADCQAFVLYAPKKNVLGALHAGWRGLNAGAIPAFFAALKNEWDIDPEETYVAAGPSLCQKCAGFSDSERELPTIPPEFIAGKNVDLRGAADAQLLKLGLPPDHFERSPDCTCCNPGKYWTYRGGDREAVRNGGTNVLACVLLNRNEKK